MSHILAPNWLSRAPLEKALRQFARTLPDGAKVIDVGCGRKPYASLFHHTHYQGIDTDPASRADIIADSTHIPLPAESVEAIICTQALQHVPDPTGTLREMYRLLKPNGRLFLSLPFATKIVGQPQGEERADYWRYTEYGLRRLLQTANFTATSITPLTGYAGTLLSSLNYFLASLNIPLLFIPLYVIHNFLGWLFDEIASALPQLLPFPKIIAWHRHIYQSFPLGYIAIARKT